MTAGQCHDRLQAEALIAQLEFEHLIADRSYDAEFLHHLAEKDVEAVIPPRINRKEQRAYDEHLYKERHLVECFINKLKQYRCIFSHFEKLAKRFLGFLSFVDALLWLR